MKKTRAKQKTRGQKRPQGKNRGTRNIDLAQVRQQITDTIGSEAEEMVWAGIEEGKKGHYQAMKFLFELAGIFPAPVEEEKSGEAKSYAEILCKQLGLPEETVEEPQVTDVPDEPLLPEEIAIKSEENA